MQALNVKEHEQIQVCSDSIRPRSQTGFFPIPKINLTPANCFSSLWFVNTHAGVHMLGRTPTSSDWWRFQLISKKSLLHQSRGLYKWRTCGLWNVPVTSNVYQKTLVFLLSEKTCGPQVHPCYGWRHVKLHYSFTRAVRSNLFKTSPSFESPAEFFEATKQASGCSLNEQEKKRWPAYFLLLLHYYTLSGYSLDKFWFWDMKQPSSMIILTQSTTAVLPLSTYCMLIG